ncbi:response regulator [Sphingomonas sp. LB-2]|uniref:ATP-binding protein n=1 Tax=Sphingomonas caeni TaxID=2984949 RepID=UPI002230174A|nr:ATP-binding protein [Sphingomonas caeni]MCW3845869.1 response regulator [Sphingomonas caeni]
MRALLARAAAWLRNLPAAAAAGLVALIVVAAGTAIILQSEASYRAQKSEEAQVQADILASSIVAAIDFGDAAAAQEAADAMRVNRQLRGVAIYDRSGTRIAGYRRDGLGQRPTLAEARSVTSPGIVAEAPVMKDRKRIGTVRLAVDRQPLDTRFGRYAVIALLVLMAAFVVGVLGVAQAMLRRANRELELRATALGEANSELTHQIAERAKAEDQLRQAQKMQALGQLTGGIAHDFNNLLTVIQGSADMLTRPGLKAERRQRFAEAIVQAAARAAALTGQLLAFARRQPLQPEVIDVNAMIAGMIDLLDRTLGERFTIRTDLSHEACAVEADRAQLASAVLNIAVNARDAMPDGGSLAIATERVHHEEGDQIAICVTDTGAGMDEETQTRALEPFFTTKGAGKGTGLGLSQVYGFATQSGGDLKIVSTPGEGTTVTILLPCSDAPLPAPETGPGEARAAQIGAVLLVEDNEEVGEFAEAMLRELGHSVTWARSAAEALQAVAERPFDVVLSDVVMPMMSGIELADQLRLLQPDLPLVLTTGYSDEIARSGTGGRPVLLKPYRIETLAAVLDEALMGAKAEAE